MTIQVGQAHALVSHRLLALVRSRADDWIVYTSLTGADREGLWGLLEPQAYCVATVPGTAEYFSYDWKASGIWNLLLVAGIALGGALAVQFLRGGGPTGISAATTADLQGLGLSDVSGLVPPELFSWAGLMTVPGLAALVLGGFLVGFSVRYVGGCTSGHGITGLTTLQVPSMIAVAGFFIGGLFTTHVLLPLLLG